MLEHHGGTVEKFIGDAVMAAFGIPVVHEDDALRAVRAAGEMREALAALNEELQAEYGVELGTRTGINTGEVVAGDPTGGHAFVTGDAVVVAQRLESVAQPGRDPDRRGHAPARAQRGPRRAARADGAEGQGAARPGVAPARGRGRRTRGRATNRRPDGRSRRGARAPPHRVRRGGPRPVLPPGHRLRPCGDRKVEARERASRRDPRRGDRPRRALPSLRRRNHVLAAAGHRPRRGPRPDSGPARGARRGRPRREANRRPGRGSHRDRRRLGDPGGDDVGRPPPVRARGTRAASDRRLRRRPVGGADAPRADRVRRRLEPRGADPHRLPREAGPARPTSRLARAGRVGLVVPALGSGGRGAARAPARRGRGRARIAEPDYRGRGGQPALRRAAAGDDHGERRPRGRPHDPAVRSTRSSPHASIGLRPRNER